MHCLQNENMYFDTNVPTLISQTVAFRHWRSEIENSHFFLALPELEILGHTRYFVGMFCICEWKRMCSLSNFTMCVHTISCTGFLVWMSGSYFHKSINVRIPSVILAPVAQAKLMNKLFSLNTVSFSGFWMGVFHISNLICTFREK